MSNINGTFYYHQNNQYSVSALTDPNGLLKECYAYTPYGQVTFFDNTGSPVTPQPSGSVVGNPFLYTGRRYDPETGLYYYRPLLQPDPRAVHEQGIQSGMERGSICTSTLGTIRRTAPIQRERTVMATKALRRVGPLWPYPARRPTP